jgi:hypothetical protein
MKEVEWVTQMATCLQRSPTFAAGNLSVRTSLKLAYGSEILSYGTSSESKHIAFETDLALVEKVGDDRWIPRVVVEAKLGSITTHDAITYSQKAASHRAVHPYLRYGIMLGHRKHYPLPGRLYRHGAQFDFMISFVGLEPTESELANFGDLLRTEVAASQTLEKILYESRRRERDHYTLLHRRLHVQ